MRAFARRWDRIAERDRPPPHLARAVISSLVEAGVTEVVIAPGSRNAPLSFAAYDAAAAGLLRLHTRIDERSAGFLALGLTRGGARAGVVCTSGTAVANLHPAILEAAHAAVPLVVVSADRPAAPARHQANQTTDQVGIFGPLVETTNLNEESDSSELRAFGDRLVAARGPAHVNVQLDDPLLPDDSWQPDVQRRERERRPQRPAPRRPATRPLHGRGRR